MMLVLMMDMIVDVMAVMTVPAMAAALDYLMIILMAIC